MWLFTLRRVKFTVQIVYFCARNSHVDESNSLFEVWKITRRRVYFTTFQIVYFCARNKLVDELNSLFEGWKITRRQVKFTVQIVYFCARNSHVEVWISLFEVWKITRWQVYFTSITQPGKINLSTCDFSPFEEWNSHFKKFISLVEWFQYLMGKLKLNEFTQRRVEIML